MPNGVPTDEVVKDAFRAEYLLTGNASKAARNVTKLLGSELNDRTARDLARELNGDADFTEARRLQRVDYLEECIAARQEIVRLATKRAKAKRPQVFHFGESGGTVLDKRPDWAKVVLDAEKNAHLAVKLTESKSGEGEPQAPAEVTINIRGPAGTTVTAD